MSTIEQIISKVGRGGALPLLVLAVGLVVALEGFGIARAGLHLIGYQQYWARLSQSAEPKARDFEGALEAIEAAGAIRSKNPAYPDDQAVVLLEHALRGGEPLPGGDDDVAKGIEALERSLALAPARAGTWTRLAIARYLRDGYTDEFADALGMSYLLGLYEPPLLQARLELSFFAWDDLSEDLRSAAEDQIEQLWRSRTGQRSIAELFVRSGHEARFALMRGIPQDERTLRYFFGQIRRFKKEREEAGLEVIPPEVYLPADDAEEPNAAPVEDGGEPAESGPEAASPVPVGGDAAADVELPLTESTPAGDDAVEASDAEGTPAAVEATVDLAALAVVEGTEAGNVPDTDENLGAEVIGAEEAGPDTPYRPRPKPSLSDGIAPNADQERSRALFD